ncbi:MULTISPECIES: alpha/beta hydrolase [unclassified Streptomyces]|uniref:alpha/beta fold hydrolase n=1 Tax=unclassified Streptomyces TaxID=2593676 RepID=UPI002E1818A0|nr:MULTISPECIES: alpha/beta hydrolase [unclassified Streptomyces]
MVLVHGVGGSLATSWGSLPGHLAEHHHVVTVDNPGSGLSPLPDGPLSLDYLADNIAMTAEQAGLERYGVVGYSMGSSIAVRHAIRHPERTATLALVAGFARPDDRLRLALRNWRALMDGDPQVLGRYLIQLSCGPSSLSGLNDDDIDRIAKETGSGLQPGTRRHIDLALGIDVRADLPHLDVPTLVVAASQDVLVAPSHSDELAEGIRGSRLVHVQAGHDAPSEQPAAIAAHIRALVSGNS